MKGQCQELPELRRSLPEKHKHQLLVLVGQMICQHLSAQESREETTTKTGHEAIAQVRAAGVH
jgi:hypothetical protein